MADDRNWVLAFESTHAAMAAQKILASLNPFVIPTPRDITANCGISLRMDEEAAIQARELLASHPDIVELCAWHARGAAGFAPAQPASGDAEPAAASLVLTGDDNPFEGSTTVEAVTYLADGTATFEDMDVQAEHTMDVYVNEVLTMRIVCSPDHLFDLVIGRLFTEGLIASVDEVASIDLVGRASRANVYLRDRTADLSRTKVETVPTCCTGNQVFNSFFEHDATMQAVTPITWKPEWVFALARRFKQDSPMHRKTFGSHSCYLAHEDEILYCCEDLGRHNAFDKVIGQALRDGVDLTQCIVFSSGRIPVDMIQKGIRARIPILVSKAVPTDMTIRLAKEFDLTLICSAHPDAMKVLNSPLVKE